MKTPLLTATLALAAAAAHAQHAGHGATPAAPYAGLQSREIKALSADEAQRLLQGHGMSLALAAELNGYPGPSHVLELAGPLRLSDAQRAQTQALMDAHKARARALGAQVVQAERELDAAFASGRASPDTVAQGTRRIGELQAQLRDEHLQTHLKQKALLDAQQVAQYNHLRGYAAAHTGGHR